MMFGDRYGTTHGVMWLFDYVVLWGHMKSLQDNISSSARPMAIKLGRWRGSAHKTKLLLNQVVTWRIKNLKLKIALLVIKETFNRNILIRNIYFFNHIVLIRNWNFFLQIHFFKTRKYSFFRGAQLHSIRLCKMCLKWSGSS